MKTLILKTEGFSAYGLQTFDIHRRANHFPTRSAVIGLLAAALGITRKEQSTLFELSENVQIAVQVNNAGEKIMDYHTVQNFRSPMGKIQKGVKPTYREYWCDSEHTFAITASDELVKRLCIAVKSPKFTLFQGRKSCPLTRPLFEVLVDHNNPVEALKKRAERGQIFSDVQGENHVATLQVRDKLTPVFRKYAIRTVYVSGQMIQNSEEIADELA
ncbi:type I-E CRISPR-associated protein Cas5/CasD [Shewanella psychromarinicola]|uniref:Type I-E CRISPR-associated protein Cas5/CasD n=1 Tax=Shewanella psychromarinicola TaxID=2487742 RepID=A0A3N4EMH9_9GAMM|nr:type I-E CRISPR-associated protein Cas5/CasD [Shewanella psychromarinicola]AZG36905.1 type I-E CRISPR-associated protein Cas5/CasD [Shewanella psychromarinicola]MCL1082524.1 type I-E CRISPR-associated protein Cas5/CasD [Shewanella psychromarinicola]RPA34761.1 type I-E CRISPR-associated protein Cas5/CasD [Shewanella psychromarinicola]